MIFFIEIELKLEIMSHQIINLINLIGYLCDDKSKLLMIIMEE